MYELLTPHFFLKNVLELSATRLRSLGIDGLILDLDGTLKDYGAANIPDPVMTWAAELKAEGFRLCLLSNGKTERIGRFAQALGVPFVAQALKPLPFGCKKALRLLGLDWSRVALVGDQIFADILAGRLAGIRTVLVPPTHTVEPWFTRLKRPLEKLVLRRLERHRPTVRVGLTS